MIAEYAIKELEMPNYDGTGPRGTGRPGRGMGRGRGQGMGRGQERGDLPPQDPAAQGYMYEYTLEELKERKQALLKEIEWIDARIKEFEENGVNS